MDLTKHYPRSVYDKLAGVVMLARATDKARASAAETLGEYNYNCGMDEAVFGFLGIDSVAYRDRVAGADDAEIERYAQEFAAKKSPAEIAAWNAEFLSREPDPESEEYFVNLRDAAAPGRSDVRTWADVLDLDEHREVPRRGA
ncbi:MAG: DUF5069 domain-containing protein [Candidatus Baltobacteraceae bacterium]